MNEHYFLKGQRVIANDKEHGEVVDAIGDKIEVKLDNGDVRTYLADELTDDSDAG